MSPKYIYIYVCVCFVADANDAGQCSITRKGVYTYQDKASTCSGTVNIGCATPNKIVIDTQCPDKHRPANGYTEKGKAIWQLVISKHTTVLTKSLETVLQKLFNSMAL